LLSGKHGRLDSQVTLKNGTYGLSSLVLGKDRGERKGFTLRAASAAALFVTSAAALFVTSAAAFTAEQLRGP